MKKYFIKRVISQYPRMVISKRLEVYKQFKSDWLAGLYIHLH